MAGKKVANGAKPNPPKKRKRKTVNKKKTMLASGANPKTPRKRTRRG